MRALLRIRESAISSARQCAQHLRIVVQDMPERFRKAKIDDRQHLNLAGALGKSCSDGARLDAPAPVDLQTGTGDEVGVVRGKK